MLINCTKLERWYSTGSPLHCMQPTVIWSLALHMIPYALSEIILANRLRNKLWAQADCASTSQMLINYGWFYFYLDKFSGKPHSPHPSMILLSLGVCDGRYPLSVKILVGLNIGSVFIPQLFPWIPWWHPNLKSPVGLNRQTCLCWLESCHSDKFT